MAADKRSVWEIVSNGYPLTRLSLVPKLKREHIQLTSFSRMRVDLAAQVSSMLTSLPHPHPYNHTLPPLPHTHCAHWYSDSYMHTLYQLPQVLSKSVCDAFSYFGDPTTKETEKFILMMDRFFDCLNVRSLNQWKEKRKPVLSWCCTHQILIT